MRKFSRVCNIEQSLNNEVCCVLAERYLRRLLHGMEATTVLVNFQEVYLANPLNPLLSLGAFASCTQATFWNTGLAPPQVCNVTSEQNDF